MARNREFDRMKTMKKISREEGDVFGKPDFCSDKKREQRKSTRDYLNEIDDLEV